MDNNNAGTLLQRRRKSVKISKEETLLILRSYLNHPTSWPEILEEVKQNINVLSPGAREVYTTGSLRQLRDRMSGKLSFLIKKRPEDIPDVDIRNAVEQIKRLERRLIPAPDPRPEPRREPLPLQNAALEGAGPAQPPNPDAREGMADAQSSDASDEEQQPRRQAPGRRRRQKKRPLAELIRENQESYNKFITKKVPKYSHFILPSSFKNL